MFITCSEKVLILSFSSKSEYLTASCKNKSFSTCSFCCVERDCNQCSCALVTASRVVDNAATLLIAGMTICNNDKFLILCRADNIATITERITLEYLNDRKFLLLS